MTDANPAEAAEILRFWFDELTPAQWWRSDPAVDAEIGRRFGALHERLAREVPARWQSTPEGALAAVLVLDQFSRNLHRGSARAFAQDAAARALAGAAIAQGHDARLPPERRLFLYLPFEHGEDMADQDRSVALIGAIGNAEWTGHAEVHREIIARFARFPRRNAALGRASTPEELAYMAESAGAY